jgi:hypothetical protein
MPRRPHKVGGADRRCGGTHDAGAAQVTMTPQSRRNLVATLGFLRIEPRAAELRLLHGWADNWRGVGIFAAALHQVGYDLVLTQHADEGWGATFLYHRPDALDRWRMGERIEAVAGSPTRRVGCFEPRRAFSVIRPLSILGSPPWSRRRGVAAAGGVGGSARGLAGTAAAELIADHPTACRSRLAFRRIRALRRTGCAPASNC